MEPAPQRPPESRGHQDAEEWSPALQPPPRPPTPDSPSGSFELCPQLPQAAKHRLRLAWEGTCGTNKEDAGRQERSGAHGGGGGRGEEARDGGAGTESPPPPLSPSWGGGVPWAARLPVQERRVLAHPPLLTGLSPWSIARAGSYLGEPGSQLQTRSRAGAWSLGGRWLRLPGPSLPRSRGRGWRSRRRRGVEGRRRKGDAAFEGGVGEGEGARRVWHRQSPAGLGFALLRCTPSSVSSHPSLEELPALCPQPGHTANLPSAPVARTLPTPAPPTPDTHTQTEY